MLSATFNLINRKTAAFLLNLKRPTEIQGFFVATHIVKLDNVNRIEPLNQKYNHHDRPYSAQQSIARRYAGVYRNGFGCTLWVG